MNTISHGRCGGGDDYPFDETRRDIRPTTAIIDDGQRGQNVHDAITSRRRLIDDTEGSQGDATGIGDRQGKGRSGAADNGLHFWCYAEVEGGASRFETADIALRTLGARYSPLIGGERGTKTITLINRRAAGQQGVRPGSAAIILQRPQVGGPAGQITGSVQSAALIAVQVVTLRLDHTVGIETILPLLLVGDNTVRQDDPAAKAAQNAGSADGAIGADGAVIQPHGVELQKDAGTVIGLIATDGAVE